MCVCVCVCVDRHNRKNTWRRHQRSINLRGVSAWNRSQMSEQQSKHPHLPPPPSSPHLLPHLLISSSPHLPPHLLISSSPPSSSPPSSPPSVFVLSGKVWSCALGFSVVGGFAVSNLTTVKLIVVHVEWSPAQLAVSMSANSWHVRGHLNQTCQITLTLNTRQLTSTCRWRRRWWCYRTRGCWTGGSALSWRRDFQPASFHRKLDHLQPFSWWCNQVFLTRPRDISQSVLVITKTAVFHRSRTSSSRFCGDQN